MVLSLSGTLRFHRIDELRDPKKFGLIYGFMENFTPAASNLPKTSKPQTELWASNSYGLCLILRLISLYDDKYFQINEYIFQIII